MNKFDQYIRNNRNAFDDLNPSKQVWMQINNNISISKKHYIQRAFIAGATSIAAIVAIVIMFSLSTQKQALTKYENELAETLAFYNTKIEIAQKDIYKLTNNNLEIKNDIELEFRMLDKTILELQNDLNDDIYNKMVIDAIIQAYRMKLEIIDQMLFHIKAQTNGEYNTEIQI